LVVVVLRPLLLLQMAVILCLVILLMLLLLLAEAQVQEVLYRLKTVQTEEVAEPELLLVRLG
jgi:hypothetical protein